MMIRRAPRPEGSQWSEIDAVSNDPRLSWPARGLLAYLLNHAEPWTQSVDHLVRQAPDTEEAPNDLEAIYELLHELMITGYVQRVDISQDDGIVDVVEYRISGTSIEADQTQVETAAAAMFARLNCSHDGLPVEILRRLK